jgi:hypothetical protein
MLVFHCTDCSSVIVGGDDEDPDAISDRLEGHIRQCPLAQFWFEGDTARGRARAEGLRSVLARERSGKKILLQ